MESDGLGTAATAIAPNLRPDTLTKQTLERMKHFIATAMTLLSDTVHYEKLA